MPTCRILQPKGASKLVTSPGSIVRLRRSRYCQLTQPCAVAQDAPKVVALEPELRRTTAVLDVANPAAPSGVTKVYVLAMSHVSSVSCDQVRELIRAVQPDVVMVELCKDRLGLLATPPPPGPRVWHTATVKVSGLPEAAGFPSAGELLSLLTCKPGRPFTADDIEADVRRLQATGLFRSVRPGAMGGTMQDAPLFVVAEDEDGVRLDTVPPFNLLEFRCEPRVLPRVTSVQCRVSSRAVAAGVRFSEEQLRGFEAGLLDAANTEDVKTVNVLMRMRGEVRAAAADMAGVSVVFDGVESGKVEAAVVLDEGEVVTGLEGSAREGEGAGIDAFVNPNREGDVKVALSSRLPAEAVEMIARRRAVSAKLGTSADGDAQEAGPSWAGLGPGLDAAVARGRGRSSWRRWSWKELATAADEDPEPQPLKDAVAEALTSAYGRLQARAGETADVEGGEAWRIAMEEAARCGVAQVVLGDRPAFITQRRLAQGIWDALAPRLAFGLVGINLAVVGGSVGLLAPGTANVALGASAAFILAMLAPVALPFAELWRFSTMAADDIEAAVRVPEPIQDNLATPMKLYGEDALIDWPGAKQSIIGERDQYMARVLASAGRGQDGQVPAFVLDQVDEYTVLRYMMADGAPNKAAPTGKGDGAYQPLEGAESVVAIVGSAHVRGICNVWQDALNNTKVDELLES